MPLAGALRREVLHHHAVLPASVKAQIIAKRISRIGTSSMEILKQQKFVPTCTALISKTQPNVCSNTEAVGT